MTDAFEWVIRTYGGALTCHNSEGVQTGGGMAIVQPMTRADWQYTAGALGAWSEDKFLCLAQPHLPLGSMGDGGHVTWQGEPYEVMTVRPVWLGGRVTHLWIALRPAGERVR